MAKKIICILMCLAVLFGCAACGGDSQSDASSGAQSNAASSGSDEIPTPTPTGPHPTLETPWVAVPFTTQKQVDLGLAGGEGSQWPTYISFDQIDGSLAFLGIDVGGMYRSKDGGKNWEPCTIGITASASSGAEVDPCNIKRVLCVGVDSGVSDTHGLYLSTDSGDSWKQVLPQRVQGHRDFRHQIAYDKSSFDKSKGYCTTIYYIRESKKIDNEYLAPALFKSTDGGETWKSVNTDKALENGIVYVHPEKGWVYVANTKGAIRSKDGGKSFSKMLDDECYGMSVVNSKPNNVYISAKTGFFVSTNGGDSFSKVNESGYPTRYPARVNVSPANPNNMVLQDDHLTQSGSYSSKIYYSNDGGKTWKTSKVDSSLSIVPYNIRQTVFAWHPKDANVCISTGGDMVMRSTDAAKTFTWSGSGYNGSCTTGIYMNVNNNDLIFCSNQDYSGAFTANGGKTWVYTPCNGNSWGGYTYGGYPISKDKVAAIATSDKKDYYIVLMTEGGTKRNTTDYQVKGDKVGHGLIGNDKVVFVGEWRSDDAGETWTEMNGCTGVYTCSKDGVLYGKDGPYQVVKSTDGGKTWQKLRMVESLSDIKYDEFNKRLLVLAAGTIKTYNESTGKMDLAMKNSFGGGSHFDVDPRNGNVYVSMPSTARCNQVGVVRTTDGGKTWVNLSRAPGDGSVGPDGGKKPGYIIFNRKYNEVWTNCGCRGVWKIGAKA